MNSREDGEKIEEVREVARQPKNKADNSELIELVRSIAARQEELSERLDEIEKKKQTSSADALIRMVNLMYDTDDKHLPELTRLPINAVRPHALGMMLEAIFDEDVQAGETPLSRKLRNNYFRLMRSVGGIHLGRGVRLAEEQAASEAEKAEEMDLGEE